MIRLVGFYGIPSIVGYLMPNPYRKTLVVLSNSSLRIERIEKVPITILWLLGANEDRWFGLVSFLCLLAHQPYWVI